MNCPCARGKHNKWERRARRGWQRLLVVAGAVPRQLSIRRPTLPGRSSPFRRVPHYTCMRRTVIYRCNEKKPDQMSLREQGRHMTNTKIKTLGNKANTESKKWEWDKYWIKTNTAADSNVNSDSDSEVWSVLTIEDEGLRQEAKNLLDFSPVSLYYLTRLT